MQMKLLKLFKACNVLRGLQMFMCMWFY